MYQPYPYPPYPYPPQPSPRRRKKQPVMAQISSMAWDWHWRSLAAIVYFIICLTDFVVMPVYREMTYNRISVQEMVKVAQTMDDPSAQVETLRILKEDRKWAPLTNDMLHISFGAILGVAALPQNRRRRNYNGTEVAVFGDWDDEGENVPPPYYPPGAQQPQPQPQQPFIPTSPPPNAYTPPPQAPPPQAPAQQPPVVSPPPLPSAEDLGFPNGPIEPPNGY